MTTEREQHLKVIADLTREKNERAGKDAVLLAAARAEHAKAVDGMRGEAARLTGRMAEVEAASAATAAEMRAKDALLETAGNEIGRLKRELAAVTAERDALKARK